VRISGFSFSGSSAIGMYVGANRSSVGSRNFRIDHCRFTGYGAWIEYDGHCTGVVDHNEFLKCTGEGMYIWGDDEAAWARDTGLGTSDFVFIEDNLFDTKGQPNGHFSLTNYGGRVVIRYNTMQETGGARCNDWIDMHGYCHGRYERGTRAFEIYNNRLIRGYTAGCCRGFFLRGGTGVVHNNTFDQAGGQFVYDSKNAPIYMVEYRASHWAGTQPSCSATCSTAQWCDSGERYPCCDQIGRGKDKCAQSSPCGQASEPLYFWNNKLHTGAAAPIVVNAGSAAYMKIGVDYIVGPKPGYTPYTYPHPLTGGAPATTTAQTTAPATTTTVGAPPPPPSNFRVIPGGS
jgi:hypothetical protein